MNHVAKTAAFVSLLALTVAGCNTGSRSAATGTTPPGAAAAPVTSSTAAPTAPAPITPTTAPPAGQVGSQYWYENDAFGNPLKTHNGTEATFAQQVLDLTNQERVANGLRPLLYDVEAERAAKAHCEDMDARGFFDHFTPEGWDQHDRLLMLGADPNLLRASGENIAVGQQTPADVVQAWMNSPGHRANILYPTFTHLGVGVAEGRPHWAQVFTTR
jgi:uncharacterized protein YkwD